MVYVAGCTAEKLYSPEVLLVVSRATCVPSLISVTETPGTIPPESFTEPRRPPVNVWAQTALAPSASSSTARDRRRDRKLLVIDILQVERTAERRPMTFACKFAGV